MTHNQTTSTLSIRKPYTVYSRYKRLIVASKYLLQNRISLISKGLKIMSPIRATRMCIINLYLISNFA